ncbi:hypothetical protein SAMN05216378_0343 [Paenibacillus catalpae]|uniref:Uncharacterized protein n=1 Tax=Paenibacillus catalpae TaxID=1045775 RepID=A0A1I1T3J6_9BACL|nr:hypothetical protein [Paenibacillus catalpae]SFD53257.1 hypothetical protein SAMN05216378_0343 [Paenibacillus catalpae]
MPRWSRIANAAASKLAAAGIIFLGFLVMVVGPHVYQMSQLTKELSLWTFIYVYAVLFSVVVDVALYKWKSGPFKRILTVMLYMLGGYVPFVVWFPNQWMLSLIAGMYGIACSLAFLAAVYFLRRCWPYNAVAAILLLSAAIYVSVNDFTVARQWTETRTADSYRAEFDYFNGDKEIPIHLDSGQTLSYRIEWQVTNGGGYGTHLDAEGGSYTKDISDGGDWIAYRVEIPSTVRIVVSGDEAKGAFTIQWQITD